MRALITGSAGFIGRHLTTALTASGYEVTGIDVAYGPDAGIRAAAPYPGIHPGMHGASGLDARDYFRHGRDRFDVAVHCAAIVGGRALIEGAPLALAANLELDAAFFAWAERTRPGRAVYLSSSAAYPVAIQNSSFSHVFGQPRHLPLCEDMISVAYPQLPDELYGWAKLTGEVLAERAQEAGVTVSVCRPFSGYAEDQGDEYPFMALAGRAARREDPFVIWGSGNQVRDFIHVDDICEAIMVMIRDGIDGPVNLGTGRATSMRDLAGLMCKAAGYDPVIKPLPDKPSGVAYRVADITRMSEFFTPKISLEEGVARALASAR